MQIEKILNNNVVQAMDNDVEYIVMGKGLGFQKKVGETVDKEKIEKIFVLENPETEAEWTRVYVDLSDGEMQVFLNIITFAEAVLQTKFEPSFFIALADHLHYAIERSREGISLQNPLAWEIRKFSPWEYEIGKQALRLIANDLEVELADDEPASVALHFVNAQKDAGLHEKDRQMTQIVVGISDIVRLDFACDLEQDSFSYNRFITHIRYLVQRIVSGVSGGKNDAFLYEQVKVNYPESFICIQKIVTYIKSSYAFELSLDE
ncbi:MAG: PRD domain-containing protein, partial [Streptococcus sp.]|nr:PRD domain-containing protein [Streptococcus sp.]